MYYGLIQPVLWVLILGASVGLGGLAFWKKRKGTGSKRTLKWIITWAIVAAISATLIMPAIGIIPPGHRGVVYRLNGGIDQSVRGEGITLLIPWIQHLTNVSVRTQKVFSAKVFSQSKDLQEITVVASVNYHVKPNKAAFIYQTIGRNYQSTVIQPALFQRTKAAVGQIRAIDFASQRDKLATTIQNQLIEQLEHYGIVIEFVNIEDAIFDPNFVKAVKNKVIAVQKAEEQFRLIQAAKAVKQQTIIQAQATGRSILIEATAQAKANIKIARSVTPSLLQWKWLVAWNGSVPSTLVTSGGNPNTGLGTGGFLLGINGASSSIYVPGAGLGP